VIFGSRRDFLYIRAFRLDGRMALHTSVRRGYTHCLSRVRIAVAQLAFQLQDTGVRFVAEGDRLGARGLRRRGVKTNRQPQDEP
jgi:hypothetical protein